MGLKVLVVDDEKIIRIFFRRLLVAQGFEVTEVEDGYRALELIKENTFDICFLDVKMPGMDGLETYRGIRKTNKEIPVVIMTGYAVEETLEQAKREGVDKTIYKPFNISQVNEIISGVQRSKFRVKPHILVVDDDENMLLFFSDLLREEKYSFETAKNSKEAVELVKEKEFDLVFLDVILKDTSGMKLYQELKELNPQLQIVFMTGYPEKGEEAKQLSGIQTCLYKPLEIEKILNFLKDLGKTE